MSDTAPAAPAAPVVPAVPPAPPPDAKAAPAAPPAPAADAKIAAGPTPEQIARSHASLAQREIQLREMQRKQTAEREAMKAQIEKAQRLERIEALAKTDPTALLKEFGVDYGTLTKAQIAANPDGSVKRADLEALRKEIAAEREAIQKAQKEAEEKTRAEAEKQRISAEYNHWKKQASETVAKGGDKYEVLSATWQELTGAPDLETVLLDVVEADYRSRVAAGEKDAQPISLEEAADRANKAAEERFDALIARREKLKKYAPKAVEPAKDVKAPDAPAAKEESPKTADAATEAKPKVRTGDQPIPMPGEEALDFLDRYRKWAESQTA